MAEQAAQLIEKHRIHPVVAKAFEWEDAKEAFAMLNAMSAVGKIVINLATSRARKPLGRRQCLGEKDWETLINLDST
jgi:hypothetical protein